MREDIPNNNRFVKPLLIAIGVMVVVGAAITLWYFAFRDTSPADEPLSQETTQQSTDSDGDGDATDNQDSSQDGSDAVDSSENNGAVTEPDPAIFSSIDVSPMAITVYYTKGVPGFQFRVYRTPNGTQYVEFSTDELVGTKCTDDEGVFASIIENPSDVESQTLSATTKVGDATYGLSLSNDTCTSDSSLLAEYQTAFKDGFSSLRALEE